MARGANAVLTSLAGATTSTPLLNTNSERKSAMFFNDSGSALYLTFSATASTTAYSIKLQPNDYYELNQALGYTGPVSGIWDTATGNCRITEVS